MTNVVPSASTARSFDARSAPSYRNYAAERWARAIVAVIDCEWDPRNLESWASVSSVGRGTIRGWCRAARITPKASLDFARLLRAVVRSQGGEWDPQGLLDLVDGRTLKRLCARGGLSDVRVGSPAPTAEEFLNAQRLVRHGSMLEALTQLLEPHRKPAALSKGPGRS